MQGNVTLNLSGKDFCASRTAARLKHVSNKKRSLLQSMNILSRFPTLRMLLRNIGYNPGISIITAFAG